MIVLNSNIKKIAALVLLTLFALAAYYHFSPEHFYKRMLQIRIEEEYSGKVQEKYIDNLDHNTPKLILSTGTIPLENTFWDEVSVGDSIVKIKGNTFIKLYRPDGSETKFDYNKYIQGLLTNS